MHLDFNVPSVPRPPAGAPPRSAPPPEEGGRISPFSRWVVAGMRERLQRCLPAAGGASSSGFIVGRGCKIKILLKLMSIDLSSRTNQIIFKKVIGQDAIYYIYIYFYSWSLPPHNLHFSSFKKPTSYADYEVESKKSHSVSIASVSAPNCTNKELNHAQITSFCDGEVLSQVVGWFPFHQWKDL